MIPRSRLARALLFGALSLAPPGAAPAATTFYPGDSLVLVLRDSTRVAGTMQDLGRVPADRYRQRYERWRQEAGEAAPLPALGTRVYLVAGRMTKDRFEFQGVGHGGIEVAAGKDSSLRTIEFFRFSSMLAPDGRRMSHGEIQKLALGGKVPLRTTLAVRADGDSRVVALEDLIGLQAGVSGPRLEPRTCVFKGPPGPGSWQVAIEGGSLWAGDPSGLGVVAHGLVLRAGPPVSVAAFGLDAVFGVIRDAEDNGAVGVDLELAIATTMPLGSRAGFQPRFGMALQAAGGFGVLDWTLGAGLAAHLTREFGLRVDYTYHRLIGTGFNYQSLSSVYIGPFWGR